MRRTRRTRDVSRNNSTGSAEEKSQNESFTRRTDEDSDFSEGKLQSAVVSLSRIVTRKSSSSDNLTDPHGGKTYKKSKTSTGINTYVKGCLPYRSKQCATGAKSTAGNGNTSSTTCTRIRRNTRNSKCNPPSHSQQMEPIAEVSNSTTSSQSDEKDSIRESYDKSAPQHNGSMRTRSRLRPRNRSVSDNSESSGISKRVSRASKKTNAPSFKSNHSRLKSQREDPAEENCVTSLPASNEPRTFSPFANKGEGPISALFSDNLNTCSPITKDDVTRSPGQFKSGRKRCTRRTVSSDENSTTSIIFENVAVPTESFYSKKSREPSCLRSWLLTAGKAKSSTPIASAGRSCTANSSYLKDITTDRRSTETAKVTAKTKEKSRNSDTEDLRNTASGKLTDKDSSNAETQLKNTMEAVNSKTPANNATIRSALKHVNVSRGHPRQQKMNEVEYLFGFENLLDPAATLLQDVSPIPQPPLPEQSRKRKKARRQKRIEAQMSSGAPSTPDKNHYIYDVIDGDDNENDIQLFEVAPIAPYSPFKIKEVTTTKSKPEKPVSNTEMISNIAKDSLPFELENALPWRDIMEHELVIEST